MAKFNERKMLSSSAEKALSTVTLPTIDIPPRKKELHISKTTTVLVAPLVLPQNRLSYTRTSHTDLPPDPLPCFYCDLVCPKPNLPMTPTSPYEVCYICLKPLSNFARDPITCCGSVMHETAWENMTVIAYLEAGGTLQQATACGSELRQDSPAPLPTKHTKPQKR